MIFILLGLLAFYLPYFSVNNLKVQNIDVELKFNGDNTYEYVQDQLNFGFRIPGTPERVNCTNYFISKFKEIDSNFSYYLHNFTIHLTECQNVLFKLNQIHNNIVILGAHYDSRARATKDPNPLNRTDPVPGANDGASGSAVLIELAEVLYHYKENLSCQVWFLFFDAEDQGRDNGGYGIDGWSWVEGSQRFVTDISNFYNTETEHFDCMILLDMVGGVNLRFINEQSSTSSLLDELFAVGRALGYSSQFPRNPERNQIIDDHKAFVNIGIPSADLIINFWDNSNWPYHHTTQDDVSSISNSSLAVAGATVEQFIYNNYLNSSIEIYKGNYPWDIDIDTFNMELIMILLITAATVAITILTKKVLKPNPSMKMIKLTNRIRE
ncbi:MAG: M28 family peptidase [Promethearchaeota archaeon]